MWTVPLRIIELIIKVTDFTIKIIRSQRKTMALEISRDFCVIVRAPFGVPQKMIDLFVDEHMQWISEHLTQMKLEMLSRPEILSSEQLYALADQAVADISARLKKYAPLVGVSYGRVTIRNQRTRWGSCSNQGNLNFNCLLMLCPEAVRDYVVVHELCHRKEMNHSPAFWALVAEVLPDYKQQRTWLKAHGAEIMDRLG